MRATLRRSVQGIGHGPHSATVRGRRPEAAAVDVLLETNMHLRLSLAGLHHPTQLQSVPYKSAEWSAAMVRLYRCIVRLHNKAVAVAVDEARTKGAAAAVSSITGVSAVDGIGKGKPSSVGQGEPSGTVDDYFLKYLLTEEQRMFGNRFVHEEFRRHVEADGVASLTFYESWYAYVLELSSGVTSRDLSEEEVRQLTEEQRETLRQLHEACTSVRQELHPTPVVP